MANPLASYDQLAHQVAALRQENSHLRRELEDNSNHLCKLETETVGMKEVLKQLQCKLEQEAGTLASSGRSDVLHQLKELHMDLTNYYELKHQGHQGHGSADNQGAPEREHCLALPPPACSSSSARSGDISVLLSPHHFLDGAPPKTAVISGADGRLSDHHMDELYKERNQLLGEIDREERERCWYFSQLDALSQKLAHLPRIDTFSLQMDFIRQQLEFEVQQVRSVMEERFGSGEEMIRRAQMRVARLEQLEKELQENQGSQECQLQLLGAERPPAGEAESNASADGTADGGNKVEMVFWLLSVLANRDKEEMSRTLLALSSSQDSCVAMRKSGCVPLLVQILHEEAGGPGEARCSREAKSRAGAALHNIVYSQQDEGQARREMRVLHMLEQVRTYCDSGWDWMESHAQTRTAGRDVPEPVEPQICQATCAIMKLSFEEEFRRAMNELGGLQVVADLIHLDHRMYGTQNDPINMALRRYAGMALTNLTFGDVVNKATLCSKKSCLQALVAQLGSDSEELHQVVSSILRNLSWRADISSKRVLRDIGCVSALMMCALQATKESTLKSLLSALWNLSAHSLENKESVCAVDGALGFLVSTLTYRCQTNSLAIIESGGGILRNVSSLVATREDYRQVLRDHNCLQTLLQHLRSHSLTIVSNACGTLWNLSSRSPRDQELLWDLGAVGTLRNLIHSKHKMIAMGSAAALRNLLSHRPPKYKDASVLSPGSCAPSLYMRKQRALEAELDARHLAETFDTLDGRGLRKQLRHAESLAKDYASDSGCFDDEEAPVCRGPDTVSVLSAYLDNSESLQKRDAEQTRSQYPQARRQAAPDDEASSAAAETLAEKITDAVAKIDRLVEDIAMHTSSEDSFSLSSEDHLADWPHGPDRSPCRLSDTSSLARRERLGRARALLRLKSAHTSVSTDSLNSSSDGYCGSKERVRSVPKTRVQQKRPDRLELKVAHQGGLSAETQEEYRDVLIPERDSADNRVPVTVEPADSDAEKNPAVQTPLSVSTKVSSDVSMASVKLSPSYQRIQSAAKTDIPAADATRKQAWVSVAEFSTVTPGRNPAIGAMETLQKYSVENTPICFSRCSSLSSLSSGPDGHEPEESDSSLEILDGGRRAEDDETLADLSDSQLLLTDSKTFPSKTPVEIPHPSKREKVFLRGPSPMEDRSPSSSSENYVQETPLVMSRCSSVSSLGSFESPSIASSIQSDPCSEMMDGTISPSDLPDSPGQTAPPSRSKTPCGAEAQSCQWENGLQKLMEVSDSKQRFNLPADMDAMIYFTVEKPTENFSCASSLSALPLHEHYVQKDVELKLTPLLQQGEKNHRDEQEQRYSEGNSDDDIEILKECINSAMPSKFRKVRPSAVPPHFPKALHLPVYMMLPNGKTQLYPGRRIVIPQKDIKFDDSSVTDSADGTPVNFSSATSLSDETLRYPAKECPSRPLDERIEDLRIFSRFRKADKVNYPRAVPSGRTSRHVVPTQKVLMQSKEVADRVASLRKRSPSRGKKTQIQASSGKLQLPVIKHKAETISDQKRNPSRSSEETKYLRRTKEASGNLSRSTGNIGRTSASRAEPRGFHKIKQNLLKDDCPAFYSLSSSLSSLSDAEFEERRSKAQQIWHKNKRNLTQRATSEEQSSPSSVSVDSEDDLLQKCITSAMPKQRRKTASRRNKAENDQKLQQKASDFWTVDEDSDDPAWDEDSDLNSVEWRAIQEGANSVVSGLQASKCQELSSEESESVLSFMSTSSFTPKERKFAKDKKANKPLDFAQRKPVANLPVVFRGRTVIYTPVKETAPSQIPPPRKASAKTDAPKNPDLAQHRSKSLHRLGRPQETELSLPKRSSTPPPRIPKSSSSGSSQSSTRSQKKPTSPTQKKSVTPASSPPERKGRSPVVEKVDKSTAKTQKSPVRIPFMQNSVKTARPLSPLVTNQTTGRQNQVGGKRVLPANRRQLSRTASSQPGAESDSNGFLRQLTFIKESENGLKRSPSRKGSPHRLVPGASTVFLCSSRCQELKVAAQIPRKTAGMCGGQTQRVQRPGVGERVGGSSERCPPRRSGSESPNRAVGRIAPGRTRGTRREQDKNDFKRHASSPTINILSRVTSRSSLRSSSSDSSGRAKSEDDAKKKSRNDTWRRIRDEDVPQILKNTLPANALALAPSPDGERAPPLPPVLLGSRSVSDATVQTEDFSGAESVGDGPGRAPVRSFHDGDPSVSGGKAEGHAVKFRQGSPSKAARVSPFNYVPSPVAVPQQDRLKTDG
nr:adenomatous polyposis coli protein 2-like [Nerophis lumbriciformis]